MNLDIFGTSDSARSEPRLSPNFTRHYPRWFANTNKKARFAKARRAVFVMLLTQENGNYLVQRVKAAGAITVIG